jgi:hypothetical protein
MRDAGRLDRLGGAKPKLKQMLSNRRALSDAVLSFLRRAVAVADRSAHDWHTPRLGWQRSRGANPAAVRLRETGATGLEPATSGVTGRRSNQLNYAPVGETV